LPSFVRNPKDFICGLLLLAVAGIFALGLRELPIGTAFRMGPGYFPMLLCGLLANGIWIPGEALRNFTWRGLLNIVLPVVFFGATLRGLGFVLSLGLTVFFTSIASVHFKIWVAFLNTAVIVFFGWLIFIWGLKLPISLLGPWVGGY
jgi:hypothetical protein